MRFLARSAATSSGVALKRSNLDDFGDYMVVDLSSNSVVDGSRFDLSLDDVQDVLNRYEGTIVAR